MKKFKKSVSSLLAFVMAVGLMLCNVVVASASTATTWNFGSGSSYRGNSSYTQTLQGDGSAEYDGLKVTTTSSGGKFSLSNSSWAQVNTGTQFDIPVEGIALILPIDHFCDMFRSATNVLGNALATSVVGKWEEDK